MLPEFLRHTPKRKAHFNCQKYPDYLSPVMTESFPHYFLYNICHKCDYAYEIEKTEMPLKICVDEENKKTVLQIVAAWKKIYKNNGVELMVIPSLCYPLCFYIAQGYCMTSVFLHIIQQPCVLTINYHIRDKLFLFLSH